MEKECLKIKDLKTYFFTDYGIVKAVDGVDLVLNYGETLGIVGESGCGKSVTALSMMRLIPDPPGKIIDGVINFCGKDLLKLNHHQIRKIRGNDISMIFQEPMTSLNPVLTIGYQISESIKLHQGLSKKDAYAKSIDMIKLVGIPSPERTIRSYPHQMSGGMRQRVMIAIALSCNPKLMIADEPTTALDVTIQAQILDLMRKLKKEVGSSIILITHNLGVIAEMAQSVAVMYTGKIVEFSGTETLFAKPLHPYTIGLMTSTPVLGKIYPTRRLNVIRGVVPDLLNLPGGCKFSDRCNESFKDCDKIEPKLIDVGDGHLIRCLKYQ